MAFFKRASCAAALSLGLIFSGAAAFAADTSSSPASSTILQTQDYVAITDKACRDYAKPSDLCINAVYNAAMDMSSDLMRNSSITTDRDNQEERLRNAGHFGICVRHREFSYIGSRFGPRPYMNQAEFCLDEAAKINDYYEASYDNKMITDLLQRVREVRTNGVAPK